MCETLEEKIKRIKREEEYQKLYKEFLNKAFGNSAEKSIGFMVELTEDNSWNDILTDYYRAMCEKELPGIFNWTIKGFDTDCIFIVGNNISKDTIEEKVRKIKEDIKNKYGNSKVEVPKTEVHKNSIVIKTEKVITKDGNKAIKILSIENVLPYEELPKEYKTTGSYLFKHVDNKCIIFANDFKYKNGLLTEDEFKQLHDYILKCGKRLREINKNLEKEKELKAKEIEKLENEWKGTETFTI